jgi:hypothetical protein
MISKGEPRKVDFFPQVEAMHRGGALRKGEHYHAMREREKGARERDAMRWKEW